MVSLTLEIINDVFKNTKLNGQGGGEASLDGLEKRDAENEALIPFFFFLSAISVISPLV